MRTPDEVDSVIEQWGRERPDLDLWPVEVLGRVTRFAAIMNRSFNEVFARHGLRNGEFDVLAAIRRSGPPYTVTPSALSAQLMLSRAGMTNRLDRLDRAGLIERRLDPDDRRSFLVTLTEQGMSTVDAAMTDHAANEAGLLSSLSDRQQRQLDDVMYALLRSLREREP
ncbi:MarR family transcriptional regulator [Actinomadura spongiicola]|uniref:MarR family transcriptional regulator n=1 Tax=Actinomadura spongiicola TaxID=2303421 RepID=A0A372GLB4_9ACTN|nr:MarR family transcriptional regulator [Actinomadura spongiicola]RFS86150.1 MarR family transcriptional regulator [Actinomadura spongiicola]